MLRPAAAAWRRSGLTARMVLPIVALGVVLLVGLLPAPYVIERPGPVVDTLGSVKASGSGGPLIRIPGRPTYPTTGRLDLLTVSVLGSPGATPSWIELAVAWFDRRQAVVPLEEVYPQGASQQQLDEQGAAQMSDSQQEAKAAALRELGYAVPATVEIAGVQAGSAASGRLRAGDVVRTANGRAVTSTSVLQSAVQSNGADRPMAIGITRDGERSTVSVTPRRVEIEGMTRPLLGVATTERFRLPFTIDIRLTDVVGPSAGMMFALGIVDKLTPGALTGGKHVAGTGTIDAAGRVGAIGGTAQKMAGARDAGATVFLAPRSNCGEVVGRVPAGLSVYAVRTLKESLRVVKTVASGASTRGLATCSAVDSAK